MFTKGQWLPWKQHWAGSKELWERHICKAHFSVVPSAEVKQIWAGLEHTVRHNDSNRGNPERFDEQILFLSCMNEKKYLRDKNFQDVRDELESFPI